MLRTRFFMFATFLVCKLSRSLRKLLVTLFGRRFKLNSPQAATTIPTGFISKSIASPVKSVKQWVAEAKSGEC